MTTTNGESERVDDEDGFEQRRWAGITRRHSAADVERLRGSVLIQHTLADRGARRLVDANVVAVGFRHFLDAVETFEQRGRDNDLWFLFVFALEVAARQ